MPIEKTNIVRGTIRDRFEKPAARLLIRAYDDNPEAGSTLLSTTITDDTGKYNIPYAYADLKNINLILRAYTPEGELVDESKYYTGVTKTKTINLNLAEFSADVGDEIAKEKTYTIHGKVVNASGLGAEGLIVEARDISSPKEYILGNPSMSLEDGSFSLNITHKSLPSAVDKGLDVRLDVLNASGEVLTSIEKYNIPSTLEVNAIIPAGLLKEISEYERLEKRILTYADKSTDLRNKPAKEVQKTIAYLSRKTRWDARLVGMYLMAQRYADKNLPAPFYYVLFRAGISSREEVLYRVNVDSALELFKNSIKKNILPQKKYNLAKLKSAWQAKATPRILETKSAVALSSMNEMLSLSLKNNTEKETFINLYFNGETDAKKTWETIEKSFDAKTIKGLKLDSQLGYLSFNNAGLIKKLKKEFKLDDPITLIKHGFYEKEAWDEYIDDKVLDTLEIEGDIKEKREYYKAWMSNQLKQSYPTAIIAEKVKNNTLKIDGNNKVKAEIYNALYHADFVLGENAINTHITTLEKEEKLLDETKVQLQRLHRTYQLSPSDEAMQVLLEQDLDSAFKIMKYEQEEFELLKFFGSKKEATAVYSEAYDTAGLLANMAFGYGTQKGNPLPAAIGKPIGGSSVKKYPKLDDLFGNLDFCSCGHCESVLSPAAYLVDLLEFIDPETGDNPLKGLLNKRPDIEHIELSCENTKTVLPYIDLVNEVLEYWAANNNNIKGFKGFNIEEGESSELLIASPQNTKEAVYTGILNKAVYPITLPFDREWALERAYSKQLNVPVHKRMEALLKNDTFAEYNNVFIEQLGLSKTAYAVLVDAEKYPVPQLFGFTGQIEIKNAKQFCKRMAIDYSDLLSLLKTTFINPTNNLKLVPVNPNKEVENCNFETLKIAHDDGKKLTDFEYLKFVRFIRLWKHLGCSIDNMDSALGRLADFEGVTETTALDNSFKTFLITLALFERVREALNISFVALLEIWKYMGVAHSDNPTLEDISGITGYRALASALKISIDELYDIMLLSARYPLKSFVYLDGNNYVVPDILSFVSMVNEIRASSLNIAGLNYLFRDKDVTDDTSPKQEAWLSLFNGLRLGLREIERQYPLDEKLTDEKAMELLVAVYGDTGSEVIKAIFDVDTNAPLLPENLIKKYPELVEIQQNYNTVADLVIDKLPTLVLQLKESFVKQSLAGALNEEPLMIALLSNTAIDNDTYLLHANANTAEPIMVDFLALSQQGRTFSADGKILQFNLIVDATSEYRFYIEGLTTATAITEFSIDSAEIALEAPANDKYVTKENTTLQAGGAYRFTIKATKSLKKAVLKWKAGEQLIVPIPEEKIFPHGTMQTYIHSYIRMSKALAWMRSMAFATDEVRYFTEDGLLNHLPVEGKIEKEKLSALYRSLMQMLRYDTVKKQLKVKSSELVNFLDDPSATYKVEEKEVSLLFKLVRWEEKELDELLQYFKGSTDIAALANIELLQKTIKVFEILKTTGLTTEELLNKINTGSSLEEVLESKYDKTSWLKLSQTVHDTLRLSQRDALVAYILRRLQQSETSKHIDTPDKLFEYFLIDVQMDACMKTSRIKQAISSVQLFIDRCLYNLESDISPTAINAKRWEWMKRYRVWEANRKIFLHPENWLDPSLRSTKSPFFKEFEGELLPGHPGTAWLSGKSRPCFAVGDMWNV